MFLIFLLLTFATPIVLSNVEVADSQTNFTCGDEIYVSRVGKDSPSCGEPESPCRDLLYALNRCPNSTVLLSSGVYPLTSPISFTLFPKVAIRGQDPNVPPQIQRLGTSGPCWIFSECSNIQVSDLEFYRCGPALTISNPPVKNTNLTIANLVFLENSRMDLENGGAIIAKNSQITISMSSFLRNSAYSGGAISVSNSQLFIYSSLFHSNFANSPPQPIALLHWGVVPSNSVITQYPLSGDEVGQQAVHPAAAGGAISISASLFVVLKNSTFQNNTVFSYGCQGRGGAVDLQFQFKVTILDCSFLSNYVKTNFNPSQTNGLGGAVSISFPNPDRLIELSSLTIENSLFQFNQVIGMTTSDGSFGGQADSGAIDVSFYRKAASTNITISSSVFDSNEATAGDGSIQSGGAYGGAISIISQFENSYSFSIYSSNLTSNRANAGNTRIQTQSIGGLALGGAAFLNGFSSLSVEGTIFSNNTASGGMSSYGGTAKGGSMALAPAFRIHPVPISIHNCIFETSTARAGAAWNYLGNSSGGAVYLEYIGSINIEISKSIFTFNSATSSFLTSTSLPNPGLSITGGALAIICLSPDLRSFSSRFVLSNSAIQSNDISLIAPSFAPQLSGGSFYVEAPLPIEISFLNTSFFDNQIKINKAQRVNARGGAISVRSQFANFSLVNCAFRSNMILLDSTLFSTAEGGALFISTNSLQLRQCQFDSNQIIGSLQVDSTDVLWGGTLFIDQGRATIFDTSFRDSLLTGSTVFGGSIFDRTPSSSLMCNLTFDRSYAISSHGNLYSFGAAIYYTFGPSLWEKNQILNSYAGYGGGIYFSNFSSHSDLYASHQPSLNNTATFGGGLLFFEDWNEMTTPAEINHSSSYGNRAAYGPLFASRSIGLTCNSSSEMLWTGQNFEIHCFIYDFFQNYVYNPSYALLLNRSLASGGIVNFGSDLSSPDSITYQYSFPVLSVLSSPGTQYRLIVSTSLSLPTNHLDTFTPLFEELPFQIRACPAGYQPRVLTSNSTTCVRCDPLQYNFDGLDCACPNCFCLSKTQCMTPPDGVIPVLSVAAGYWPHPSWLQPKELLICPNFISCLPFSCSLSPNPENSLTWVVNCSGTDGKSSSCNEGYTNRLCSECLSGWFQVGNSCFKCPNSSLWVAPFFFVSLFLLVLSLGFRFYLLSSIISIIVVLGSYISNIAPLWFVGLIFYFGLLVIVEIQKSKSATVDDRYNPINGIGISFLFYVQFATYLTASGQSNSESSSSGFSFLKITGPECISSTLFGNFLGRFSLNLLLPFFGMLIAGLILLLEWSTSRIKQLFQKYLARSRRVPSESTLDDPISDDARDSLFPLPQMALTDEPNPPFDWSAATQRICQYYLYFCYSIYTDLTEKLFQVTDCDKYGYISEVPYIPCASELDSTDFYPGGILFVCALTYLIFFSLGLPSFLAFLIYRRRNSLSQPDTKQLLAYLYESYRPKLYLWGIYGYFRNFILLCLTIYIPTGSQAYMLSILIVLGSALFLQHWKKPFVTSLENWIEQFSIMSLIVLHVATQYGTLIDAYRSGFFTPTRLFIISFIGFSLIVFGIAGIVCLRDLLQQVLERCRSMCQQKDDGRSYEIVENSSDDDFLSKN